MIRLTFKNGFTGETVVLDFAYSWMAVCAAEHHYHLEPFRWRGEGGKLLNRVESVYGDVYTLEEIPGEAPSPHNTTARTIRPVLRRAGLEHLVEKVSSGRRRTHVRLRWHGDKGRLLAETERVMAALRPLWHDADRRVSMLYAGSVSIDRGGWYCTNPQTSVSTA